MLRRLHLAFVALAFFLSLGLSSITGCGNQPYPAHLSYPLRSDGIVAKLPDNAPDGPPPAGKLDEFIDRINERGGTVYQPRNLTDRQRAELGAALDETFGTPAAPLVRCLDEANRALVEQLHLQPERLAEGSTLYKKHCLQCHGLTGDGRGPTGQWVYPFPRDFRQGIFKFVSSAGSAARKPTRSDLLRVLSKGVDRTSMPSFSLLSEESRELIVDYTIHLSLRGEVEYRIMRSILSQSDEVEDRMIDAVRSRLNVALNQWCAANEEMLEPATMPTPEDDGGKMSADHFASVRRGFELFSNQSTGCIGCHLDYGRQARYLYDAWGGAVRPTDLTEGAFRGGKAPIDLFRCIRGGIGPSGMPAATSLRESSVWDLVHFVQALPFFRMLPADIRMRIYPLR